MTMSKALEIANKVGMRFNAYIQAHVDSQVVEHSWDPRRFYLLRSSTLPYCGLRRFLQSIVLEDRETNYQDFGMTYYVNVGTRVHEVFQDLLGRGGQIIGNWWCPKCKAVVSKVSSYKKCRHCGASPRYEELEINRGRTLVGHVDGIYWDKLTDTYWIIDYKTTSSTRAYGHKKALKTGAKTFPYTSNVFQIMSYCPTIETQYNLKISGWILAYLPRDNPMNSRVICIESVSKSDKAHELKTLDRDIKIHRFMLKAKNKQHTKVLLKHRLCTSEQDYMDNYHDEFNTCPYAKKCFTTKMERVIDMSLNKGKELKTLPLISTAPKTIRKELGL